MASPSDPRLGAGLAGRLNRGNVRGGAVGVAFVFLGETYDHKLSDSLLRKAIVWRDGMASSRCQCVGCRKGWRPQQVDGWVSHSDEAGQARAS